MLATVPVEVASAVAEDIRRFGHGYVRFDREGRAEHVPAHAVVEPAPLVVRCDRRMHE